jgi:hypothetical protein
MKKRVRFGRHDHTRLLVELSWCNTLGVTNKQIYRIFKAANLLPNFRGKRPWRIRRGGAMPRAAPEEA